MNGLSHYNQIQAITKHQCQRCGGVIQENDLDEYYRFYCPECDMFGRIVEGQLLYRYHRIIPNQIHEMRLEFELSKEQKEASQFLLKSIITKHIGFLYAVCGAGKTEILYETIYHFLTNNQKICFAIPRTDVVIELSSRLIKIFPKTVIKPLYHKEKDDSCAHVVVSTIHQLIHYFEEFDLIILDEADAFPYKSNPLLTRLVKRALKPDGAFIMMSATYEYKELKYIEKNKQPMYQLPARFHRHCLDTFTILYVNQIMAPNNAMTLNPVMLDWILSKVNAVIPLLLFVPTIELGNIIEKALKHSNISCYNVSSIDENRAMKINQFRASKKPVLITTTLLERGITIKGVHVGILEANHKVFNRHTLIQIAGRVGRHFDAPNGEIVLFTNRMNSEIKAAMKYIKHMNKLALKRGLISDDL